MIRFKTIYTYNIYNNMKTSILQVVMTGLLTAMTSCSSFRGLIWKRNASVKYLSPFLRSSTRSKLECFNICIKNINCKVFTYCKHDEQSSCPTKNCQHFNEPRIYNYELTYDSSSTVYLKGTSEYEAGHRFSKLR